MRGNLIEESVATSFERARQEFGEQLRALRGATGLNAKQFAERLGWNAPKVTKLEKGNQTASQADLMDWLAAVDATDAQSSELLDALDRVNEHHLAWREQVRQGRRGLQVSMLELEARAIRIRAVEFGLVPGLLQTAEYATHVLEASREVFGGADDIAAAVRARIQRQQVLYNGGKQIEILVAEAALLHPIAPAAVMLGQLHRLMGTVGMPNVRFGVLPARRRLPYWPTEGYWMVDQLVIVEWLGAEEQVTDPDQVAVYHEVTDRLWTAAVEGDEARALLLRVYDEYKAESE